MRRLTMREVREQHGGILPPDAVFRPDEDEQPARPAPVPQPKRRTRSERFSALNAFVDFGIADADLTPAESLVWLVLFRDTKPTAPPAPDRPISPAGPGSTFARFAAP